jgi:hypothetical protein
MGVKQATGCGRDSGVIRRWIAIDGGIRLRWDFRLAVATYTNHHFFKPAGRNLLAGFGD